MLLGLYGTKILKMRNNKSNQEIQFIAVDWGANNFRAYAVDYNGNVRQRTKSQQGITRIRDNNFASALRRILGKWFNKYPGVPLVIQGLVGAKDGWQEIDYAACPLEINDLVMSTEKIVNHCFNRDIYLVPCVKQVNDDQQTVDYVCGEETLVFGALSLFDLPAKQYACCPGTHSKWLTFHNGSLTDINTFFTGELYALLSRFSSMSQHLDGAFTDMQAFQQGLELVKTKNMLLHNICDIYSKGTTQQLNKIALASYLSAVLVGSELLSAKQLYPDLEKIILIATPWLIDMYQTAADYFGLQVVPIKSDIARVAGLYQIYNKLPQNKNRSFKIANGNV